MKRAIVVTIVLAVLALAAVLIWNSGGQASGPLRPAPETKRDAPGKGVNGFGPGAEAPPENPSPSDE